MKLLYISRKAVLHNEEQPFSLPPNIRYSIVRTQGIVTRPQDTVLVLVTDLYEGGDPREMRKRFASLVDSGVQLIVLPALNDDGAPSYDKNHAEFLASIGVPTFACTPDKFPDSSQLAQKLFTERTLL